VALPGRSAADGRQALRALQPAWASRYWRSLPHSQREALTHRWEYAHSIIDDHSRLAYTELLSDEQAASVTVFLERALAFFAGHGIDPRRLQTDNHFSYVKNRSLRELLARHGIQHRFIPPRTPKRNGKVCYQQTLAREWAYGQRYRSSNARATALPIWLKHYNIIRNHSGIGNRPPIHRVRNHLRQNI
jgi:transposase InsO family protein